MKADRSQAERQALPARAAASLLLLLWLGLLTAGSLGQTAPSRDLVSQVGAEPDPAIFNALQYRYIGPQGNRTGAVAGVAGNSNIIYVGAASGGIFKSTDGGVHWNPIFDGQLVASIGALAVAPSDSNIVWAGTGETFIRGNVSIGNGVYKSLDAGKSWTHMGLDLTGRISEIVVDPHDPNTVYVAAMGHCYGPQQERGVFRSMDGGKTWERVLFVDENTGASDLAMDPNNPRVLFAGMWQLELRPWNLNSGGPGSGLYVSRDGGTTWKHLTGHGMPESPLGRIGVAIAPSNSNRVYALIETDDKGVLWRSDDGGENWKMINGDRSLNRRPHYFSRMAVLPDNPNELYFCTFMELTHSTDGGMTTTATRAVLPDNHEMWIDPRIPSHMVVTNDRYVNISTNRGESWLRSALPIAQMYHVSTDDQIPYYVYGNRQDGPADRGPSNSLATTQILAHDWAWAGGAESGYTYPDPADPDFVWTSGAAGYLTHLNIRTLQYRPVTPAPFGRGWPIADLQYRLQWTFPIALSPHDPHKLYVGSQYVHVSTDAGQTWTVISPDLTTNDKSKQQPSGGLSPGNTGGEHYCVLFAIAESPKDKDVIWAGSNDGLVHVTRDGGKHWTDVTKNLPSLPPWGTVSNIAPSRYNAGAAYVVVDLHQMNDRNPYVFKTADYGSTWTPITSGIPRDVFSYVHFIHEDPVKKGLLYLGTENAIYVSFNDGAHWMPLQLNLPHVAVTEITVQERFHDLVLATYGRGFWILDDISPLEQLNTDIDNSGQYLFDVRPAYRFHTLDESRSPVDLGDENDPPPTAGHNPPYGASINYYLKSAPTEEVKFEISDKEGHLIRALTRPGQAGINRLWWDLKYESTKEPRLRTSPIGHPEIGLGPQGWRAFTISGRLAPLVPPGIYTVKMKVGQTELIRTVEVKRDPNALGSEEGILAQNKTVFQLRTALTESVDVIDRAESIRKQIGDVRIVLQTDPRWKSLADEAEALDNKLLAVEEVLFDPRIPASADSAYYPPKLYHKIQSIASDMMLSDYQPTAAQLDAAGQLTRDIAAVRSKFDALNETDVAGFNDHIKSANVPHGAIGR